NKALIIKSAALTGVESGTSDSTSAVSIPFLSETAVGALPAGYNSNQRGGHYFDSDGSNGYQDSGSATYTGSDDPKYKYGLKGAIDYYYEHTLKTYQDSILAVDLHDPDFDSFKAGFPLTDDDYKTYDEHDDYDNWSGFWYEGLSADTRFATTYSSAGTKQAFVLSYGDLSRTTSEKKWIDYGAGSVEVSYSKLLDFLGGDGSVMDIFWLRSGGDAWSAGTVINGAYSDSLILDIKWNVENFSTRIRPALWVTLS
ncbi:MAG: hypothetical protein LBS33_04295, partial [Streptococcaceae bacterium]|nr:hypothetical protein [Streptococcaceae bacterium]